MQKTRPSPEGTRVRHDFSGEDNSLQKLIREPRGTERCGEGAHAHGAGEESSAVPSGCLESGDAGLRTCQLLQYTLRTLRFYSEDFEAITGFQRKNTNFLKVNLNFR